MQLLNASQKTLSCYNRIWYELIFLAVISTVEGICITFNNYPLIFAFGALIGINLALITTKIQRFAASYGVDVAKHIQVSIVKGDYSISETKTNNV